MNDRWYFYSRVLIDGRFLRPDAIQTIELQERKMERINFGVRPMLNN